MSSDTYNYHIPEYSAVSAEYSSAEIVPFPQPSFKELDAQTVSAEEHTANAVEKLGTLTCIKSLSSARDPLSRQPRLRQIAQFSMIAGDFELRITEPATDPGDDPAMIAMFPGFSESPNAAAAREFHDSIAEVYPGSKVISVSTEGVSDYCIARLEGASFSRSLDKVAFNRLSILREISKDFAEDEQMGIIGVSMGSKIATRMAMQNLDREMVNIDQLGFHDPAVVTPDHILKDMVLQFPSHVGRDMAAMFVKHPFRSAKCMTGNKISGPKRVASKALAMSANVIDLLQGTDFDEIDAVSETHHVGVAGGAHDPLLQPAMWEKLKQRHPDNVRIKINPHAGHLSTIDAPQAALDMRDVLGQF